MHDMFSGRQADVAIATGVGHKPGGIFDWLSGEMGGTACLTCALLQDPPPPVQVVI